MSLFNGSVCSSVLAVTGRFLVHTNVRGPRSAQQSKCAQDVSKSPKGPTRLHRRGAVAHLEQPLEALARPRLAQEESGEAHFESGRANKGRRW